MRARNMTRTAFFMLSGTWQPVGIWLPCKYKSCASFNHYHASNSSRISEKTDCHRNMWLSIKCKASGYAVSITWTERRDLSSPQESFDQWPTSEIMSWIYFMIYFGLKHYFKHVIYHNFQDDAIHQTMRFHHVYLLYSIVVDKNDFHLNIFS